MNERYCSWACSTTMTMVKIAMHVTICLRQNTSILRKTWPLVSCSLVFHSCSFHSYAENKNSESLFMCTQFHMEWVKLQISRSNVFFQGGWGGYHLNDAEYLYPNAISLSDFFFSFHLKSYLHDATSANTTLLTTLPTYNAYFIINFTARNITHYTARY